MEENNNIELTDRQEMFCREYIIDFNATQSAIRAGYSENSAKVIGCENLTKPNIQAFLSKLMKERNERVKIDADYVLNRLVEIDTLDVLDIVDDKLNIKPIEQWSRAWRTSVTAIDVAELKESGDVIGFLKKVRMPDKLKNLELIGKHTDVNAFKERIDHTSNGKDIMQSIQIEVVDNRDKVDEDE